MSAATARWPATLAWGMRGTTHLAAILPVRISAEADHPFRTNPITCFGASRSPISVEADHLRRCADGSHGRPAFPGDFYPEGGGASSETSYATGVRGTSPRVRPRPEPAGGGPRPRARPEHGQRLPPAVPGVGIGLADPDRTGCGRRRGAALCRSRAADRRAAGARLGGDPCGAEAEGRDAATTLDRERAARPSGLSEHAIP